MYRCLIMALRDILRTCSDCVAFGGIADIKQRAGPANLVENDPEQTSRVGTCTMAFTSTH